MKKIEFDMKCKSCKGTGLYVGMAEREGVAVVCHTCKGEGHHLFAMEYEEFSELQRREKVTRVVEVNPGIILNADSKYGGMAYEDWLSGKPFPEHSENRECTCPAWWYQSADYDKKPDWDECWETFGGTFSSCKHFLNKEKCWARFDRQTFDE